MDTTIPNSHDISGFETRPIDSIDLRHLLPRLQVVDESSPSKPDNYRISPITPQSTKTPPSPSIPHDLPQKAEVSTTTIHDLFENWSGRGHHVDFLPHETVPLKEGRFLGHGSMGGVYETVIRGHAFAWKRRFCRRRIGEAERKEIEILNKVSHEHIVKLAGSYTHRQFLGLLLYPVAACDLATLFEDVEAWIAHTSDATQDERLREFQLVRTKGIVYKYCGEFLLEKMGCIVKAVEYLHNQKVCIYRFLITLMPVQPWYFGIIYSKMSCALLTLCLNLRSATRTSNHRIYFFPPPAYGSPILAPQPTSLFKPFPPPRIVSVGRQSILRLRSPPSIRVDALQISFLLAV